MKTAKRAYKINTPLFFQCGKRYARSAYYETDNPKDIALLDSAKAGTVERIRLRLFEEVHADPHGDPHAEGSKSGGETPETPKSEDGGEGDKGKKETEVKGEPDWAFMTIPNLRVWLDRTGVGLPGKRAGKATHENLCHEAWIGGLRPHPLWALPGGREPSPGIPAPAPTEEALRSAIEACDAAGILVPEAARSALAASALMAPDHEDRVAAGDLPKEAEELTKEEEATEAPSEPAGDPQEEEAASESQPEGEPE